MRRLKKLMYRVVFPFELKLRNVADECADADNVFHLFAVVVHVGSGLNHGAPLACLTCNGKLHRIARDLYEHVEISHSATSSTGQVRLPHTFVTRQQQHQPFVCGCCRGSGLEI